MKSCDISMDKNKVKSILCSLDLRAHFGNIYLDVRFAHETRWLDLLSPACESRLASKNLSQPRLNILAIPQPLRNVSLKHLFRAKKVRTILHSHKQHVCRRALKAVKAPAFSMFRRSTQSDVLEHCVGFGVN